MLYEDTLNQMDEDELRNYANIMNKIEGKYGELVSAKDAVIGAQDLLIRAKREEHDALWNLNMTRDRYADFIHEMEKKYHDNDVICRKEMVPND